MTKVDERSDVPRVGAAERAVLGRALDRPGVVAARLIGSQATGRAGPRSDIDVAVWLLGDRDQREASARSLARACAAAVGTDEVDVITLDDASPLLRHRALRDGVVLVDRDHDERIRRETAALLEYLDTAPLRRLQNEAVRRAFAEDRFGRP